MPKKKTTLLDALMGAAAPKEDEASAREEQEDKERKAEAFVNKADYSPVLPGFEQVNEPNQEKTIDLYRVNFRIPKEMHDHILEEAERLTESLRFKVRLSDIMRQIVAKHFDSQD